jgi:hypothetical protein
MAFFPILTTDGDTIVTADGFAVVIEGTPAPPPVTGVTVVIPDADEDFWGAELTVAAGGVSNFNSAIPNSEWGAALPLGGNIALNPKPTPTSIQIYDADWALVATIPAMLGSTSIYQRIAANPTTSLFYYSNGGSGAGAVTLHQSTDAGVVSGTVWTLPANSRTPLSMAVSRDDGTAYYSSLISGQAVYAYDLVGMAPKANLVAAGAHFATDIITLSDDSVVIAYQGTANQVIRVDASGTLLNTYSFPSKAAHRLGIHPDDDPSTFWVWTYVGSNVSSVFYHVNVSDGATIESIPAPIYLGGVLNAFTDSTPQVFGTSDTCPFLVLGAEAPPFTSTTFPIRRLRRWMP